MQIRYRNTLEDAVVLNRCHHSNSSTVKKQRTNAMVYGPIMFIALMALAAAMMQEVAILVWGCIGVALYMFLILNL